MSYCEAIDSLSKKVGVEYSTMMKTPCLRYKDEFLECFLIKKTP